MHVCANLDGMDLSESSLVEALGLHSSTNVEAWAAAHGIKPDSLPDCIECIHHVAAAAIANPGMVNPDLPPSQAN